MKLNTQYFYKKYKEKGGKLTYNQFKVILESYHKKVIDLCVDKGLGLKFRSNLGFLCVHRYVRKPKIKENGQLSAMVDWNASNKLKQSIIDEGKVPLEMFKDEQGNIIGNNGGVAWLCYYTNTTHYKWLYDSNDFLKNGAKFRFKISWGNTKKLAKGINEDSEMLYH